MGGFHEKLVTFKGGPEPLEKLIHEILGSKREDRFSNTFFELVQNTCQVLLRYGNLCEGADTAKVPTEVPEDSRVLTARRLYTQTLIASTPGSSPGPPKRLGLDKARVNHGLRQSVPVTTLLVLCLVFFNKKSVTKRK